MYVKILTLVYIILSAGCGYSQQDNKILVTEAGNKLEKGTSVSEILMDKKYDPVHSETSFRELIKKFASSAPVRITPVGEPGNLIQVKGVVKNSQGQPQPGVTIYFYQTDSRGWYLAERPHVGGNSGDQDHARLFGYVKTGPGGEFEIHTVKPSGYPGSDLPAHIHFAISESDVYRTMINEFLFDDDERLVGKARENVTRYHLLVSKPEKGQPPFIQSFSYVIVLQNKR